jgi:hypothetical protein
MIEVEIEKAHYDRTIWEQKVTVCKREIANFTGQLEEMVDKSKGIEYYLDTNEEEDKKYWISRMAKQAACDMISFGHVGTGNMDSIMNLPPDDQIQVLSGAVHHSALIGAGVEKMRQQMSGSVANILEGGVFNPPQINGSEILKTEENPPQLSEVKHDIPKEKIRLQSSNKPKD